MRILLSGSSGYIGQSLLFYLQAKHHEVVRLVRSKAEERKDAIYWNPTTEELDPDKFEGFDAVIHLAGKNIFSRWTKKTKQELFLSRVRDTWLLSKVLSRLNRPPKTFICASAIGYYGDRGEELLTEDDAKGEGFLADLCAKWESATSSLEEKGIRVIHPRFGIVLSPDGGALAKMLPAFRMGLGARMGNGKQWMSWIAMEDLIGAIYHLLQNQELQGVFNLVSTHPIRQRDFAHALARSLHRWVFLAIPAFLLKLFLGEMAKETLLASEKVYPKRLLISNYSFAYPRLEDFLHRYFAL